MHIQTYHSPAPDAEHLVLLHGWAMHSGIWGEVLARLQPFHHLWCVDLPGHGQARDIDWPGQPLELASQLAGQVPDNSIWLGWSMGGLMALEAARKSLCKALILVASNPCFIHQTHWPYAMPGEVFQQFADDLTGNFERTLKRFLALEVHGCDDARRQLQQLHQTAFAHGAPALGALQGGLELLQQADFSPHLTALNLPALIVGGRRDRLIPWTALEQTENLMPNARLKRIPGAGHAPFIGDPEAFSNTVLEFCHEL